MNYLKQTARTNPEATSNIISKTFVLYTRKLFVNGFKRDLTEDDIYEVLPSYRTDSLGDRLEKSWKRTVHKTDFSILFALWHSFGLEFMLISCTQVIPIVLTFFRPRILKMFLSFYTDNSKVSEGEAYFYGLTLIFIVFVDSVYTVNFKLVMQGLGIKMRNAICCLLYRKALKTNLSQLEDVSVGKFITLVTKDVYDLENYLRFLSSAWTGTVRMIVLCIVLYIEIGWLIFIIFGAFLVLFAIQGIFGLVVNTLKLKLSKETDQRYQTTKEILSAIKLVKLLISDNFLEAKVTKIRKSEMDLLQIVSFILFLQRAISEMILNILWYLLLFSSIWFGKNLPIETFFLAMNTLHSVESMLKMGVPRVSHDAGKVAAALKRIGSVLKAIDEKTFTRTNHENERPEISLLNVDIYVQNRKILRNVSLTVDKNLTAIQGSVGSGKSLLLKTILQEHQTFTGSLKTGGTISYVPQEAWLLPSTIKQNILFGSEFDEERYREVVEICALVEDFKSFKDGDNTIIMDKGSNLSKGQQARISLARAVYKNSDVYLLDDPLSSLDAPVANFIFSNCITHFLRNKIVVMVTQNPSYINRANYLLVLKDGKANFVHNLEKCLQLERTQLFEIIGSTEEQNQEDDNDINETTKLIRETPPNYQIYKEENKSGGIPCHIYKKYVTLGGPKTLIMVLFLFSIAQILRSTKDKLQSSWLNTEQKILTCTNSNCTDPNEDMKIRTKMIYLYPTVATVILTFTVLSAYTNFYFAKIISLRLHKLILTKIIHAATQFLDSYFLGNILNRFSRDFTFVDENIPNSYYRMVDSIFQVIGVITVIASVNAIFLIPSAIFLSSLIIFRICYSKTGRNLRRLELSTRSPVIGHLNATLNGLSSIRAFKTENIMQQEFETYQNLHISVSYIYYCCLAALNLGVEMCANAFVATVIIKFLLINDGVAHVGLVLSQALILTGTLAKGIRRWAEIENEMTSVERILEFNELKQEPAQGISVKNWPFRGEISYENVCFSYKNSKNRVLDNASFTIKPKETVAVVGRTGAGKTSLLNVLLRFYPIEGRILVDDLNIETISLDLYRSKISVVLQDPILFTGTIRNNIDPAGRYPDDIIWNVLKTIQMESAFPSLDFHIENAGSSFSIGQKQLICLGRAIIRDNKIVILDEVTANVDSETETLIEKIIFQHFSSSTVLVVTHKLDLASRCDRVMAIEGGKINQITCAAFNKMFEK